MKLKTIKSSDLKAIREKQWLKQNKKCPILDQEIAFEDSVLDHKHITKKDKTDDNIGEDGKGLIRGVLHNQANAWEGKVTNSFKRTGMHKLNIHIWDALRNLAEFLEHPLMKEKIIHPTENKKPKKLKKRDFNRVLKYYKIMYPKRKKLPIWKEDKKGKSNMKLTKAWEEMILMAKKLSINNKK